MKFEGVTPSERTIPVDADPYCQAKHAEGLKTEMYRVGPDGGLGNAFVWIKKGIKGKFAAPSTPVVLDQNGCHYAPHVFGLQTGQELIIRNSDETMHNVHALSKVAEFNLAQAKKGDEVKKKFNLQEVMVKVKCDVHGWMGAWMGVVSHPYFFVTKEDGKFELTNVPPGEYEVEAWHEKFGTQQFQVKLEAKGSATANFTFKGE